MNRRDFLTVLGVTGAGVASAGCGTGRGDTFLPYVRPPEEVVPGVATFYTTTCRECPAGCGLHVETHSGRATKVEGNPTHPISHGNTCARGQASVQGLYHPDRHQGPFLRERSVGGNRRDVSWAVAEQQVAEAIRAAGAGGVALLTGAYRGTMGTLLDTFAQATGARRVEYAPLEDAPRDLRFEDADVLVSFGADFLETWGSPVDYAYQYAGMKAFRGGVPAERAPRFIWVGPHRPLTGLNADLWIDARPGTEVLVAQALAGRVPLETAAQEAGVRPEKLQKAMEWWRGAARPMAMGPGAAVAGSRAELRRAVDGLNGRGSAPAADLRPLQQLVADMNAGRIRVLIIAGCDPVYSLPGGMGFRAALEAGRVPTVVSFASFPDDTSAHATHVLPDHHFLEAWDDYNPRGDTWLLVQPTMRPVFNTKQTGDVVLSVAARLGIATPAPTYFEYLRTAWAGRAGGDAAWRDALKRGGVWAEAPGAPQGPGAADAAAVPAPAQAPVAPAAYRPVQWEGQGLHLVVYPSLRFFDGRNANRPWLLELPDPVTKVPWDSFVELHPRTAEELGVAQGDIVKLESAHGSVEAPAYVWPGVREGVAAVQMGLGHEGFGRYTQGRGVNPMRLLGPQLDADGGLAPAVRVQATRVARNPGRWEGMFEQGVRVQYDRAIAQAVSWKTLGEMAGQPGVIPGADQDIEELRIGGGFGPAPAHTDPSSFPRAGTEYGEYIDGNTRWGLTVDLSRCTGCSACVVACNAENNIPVVGHKEMKRGRELHWLRIERYFGVGRDPAEAYTDTATDDVRFLPMLCQHCGNAPCEPVCPVYAAYHTPDGLNAQVYNRCVGTRYCANNCPYKVRVFNWFTYEYASPLHLQLNPDVTVREKGVMEKCTFCVQRIHETERRASLENRRVRDGEVMPACVQACPTEVFTFGNFQDPDSQVSRAARTTRSYRALGELNTQPGIVYLKKVTIHDNPLNGGHADVMPAPFGGDEHMPQGGEAATPHGGGH